MTVIELLPVVELDAGDTDVSMLDAYAAAQPLLAGVDSYRRVRVRAAQRFLAEHPDLHVWMARPTDERLADIAARAERVAVDHVRSDLDTAAHRRRVLVA